MAGGGFPDAGWPGSFVEPLRDGFAGREKAPSVVFPMARKQIFLPESSSCKEKVPEGDGKNRFRQLS
jgi:hypothetical protein